MEHTVEVYADAPAPAATHALSPGPAARRPAAGAAAAPSPAAAALSGSRRSLADARARAEEELVLRDANLLLASVGLGGARARRGLAALGDYEELRRLAPEFAVAAGRACLGRVAGLDARTDGGPLSAQGRHGAAVVAPVLAALAARGGAGAARPLDAEAVAAGERGALAALIAALAAVADENARADEAAREADARGRGLRHRAAAA